MSALLELQSLMNRHAGQELLPAIGITTSAVETAPMPAVSDPVFALVAQGRKRTILGDTEFHYGAGEYLVVSAELPVVAHVTAAPYAVVGLRLRPALIADLLLETTPPASPPTGPAVAVSRAPDNLLDAVVRLVRLLDEPAAIPVLAPAYEKEIVWRLITGEQGAMVRQIGLADSSLAQISRAIRWIRRNYADLFRVEDAARIAGMSVTSFHRHFRAVTTLTPIQYKKQIRLQEARARLIADPHDVAAVGYAVGYESPSQFSREYRRMFGLPPSADAARLHRDPAAQLPMIA
ncbi:AraC family transcriptional regulator [Actinoplanes sp. N902-109]|uniref:AraC family transcriptional regulator n=1 Tax=Actinoplanes sp. (strain N902-109) TaxID=649831 RepID=UPI00032938FC|nr:AraC family transcriptional regulator [Actinoplanes sp. N902-109]AGL15363.1 AraC family transcriptional regulator [Actinoplanes sp. N902-109]